MVYTIEKPGKTIKINVDKIYRIQRKSIFLLYDIVINDLTEEQVEEVINFLTAHNIFDYTFDNTFD